MMPPPVGMGGPPPGFNMAMHASAAADPQFYDAAASLQRPPQQGQQGQPWGAPPSEAGSSHHAMAASPGHPLLGRPVPDPPAMLRAFGAVPQPAPMPAMPQPPPPAQLTAEADWLYLKQQVEGILKESTQIS